jgi:hypothetical protein
MMGWWRIEGSSGLIDWASRGANGAVLENYIPGLHSAENNYNGDEVADILDKVISTMTDRLTDPEYRANAQQAFLGLLDTDDAIDFVHKQSLDAARQKIERVYQREWQRNAYPEELRGLFEFCTAFIKPVQNK